jgi:propanol-preferring alcohol dehydrogenase
LVLRGITLKGSLVGTREDLREALDFAARGKVRSEIVVQDASEVNAIFQQLRSGNVLGRVVLDLQHIRLL